MVRTRPRTRRSTDIENKEPFVLLEASVQRSITCSGLQKRTDSDGRLEVAANIRNRESRRIQVQVSCEFKDEQGFVVDTSPVPELHSQPTCSGALSGNRAEFESKGIHHQGQGGTIVKTPHAHPAGLGLPLAIGLVFTAAHSVARAADNEKVNSRFTYEQKAYSGSPGAASSEAAAAALESFKAAYPKLGSPRILIYVNRELVDQRSGMKLAGREETVVSTKREAARGGQPESTESVSTVQQTAGPASANTETTTPAPVEASPAKPSSAAQKRRLRMSTSTEKTERDEESLEYRQSVRDVEQAFGRRLRSAGASLADQRVATQLIADRPLSAFTAPTEGEQANKDREALARITDVVVEILITERSISVPKISENVTHKVPEIYATAIRLRDSKVMGQASSRDANRFHSREIADATALSLMEDMTLGVQQ